MRTPVISGQTSPQFRARSSFSTTALGHQVPNAVGDQKAVGSACAQARRDGETREFVIVNAKKQTVGHYS